MLRVLKYSLAILNTYPRSVVIAYSDFYSWNPAVGTSCASLWPGYYVCIAIL